MIRRVARLCRDGPLCKRLHLMEDTPLGRQRCAEVSNLAVVSLSLYIDHLQWASKTWTSDLLCKMRFIFLKQSWRKVVALLDFLNVCRPFIQKC